MVQRRSDARFALKALEDLGTRRQIVRQELQRDLTAEPQILSAVDDAHPTRAEAIEDPVVAEGCPNHM